jgi:dTDP-glucose 4,6-dehydratase
MTSLVGMDQGLKPAYADAISDEPQRRCPSIEKAKTSFGYEPKLDLASGLAKTIDWFRTQK